MSLSEMKERCAAIEAKIVGAKGPAYLKALYDREGVSQYRPGSLDYMKAQIAALSVEASRMEGEQAAAAGARIAPPTVPTQAANTISTGNMSAVQALAHFESLLNGAQPKAAAKYWEDNGLLMLQATGWADRATSAADAEQKYMRLVALGRSYEAGRFWQNNRDLLNR